MYEKHYYKANEGRGFHYLKYTPKKMTGEKMPLLVFMHGAGERGDEDGTQMDKIAKMGYFAQMAQGKEFPLMIVAPQCPTGHYWMSYMESLNRFLDYIIEENNIDTDRIYLTGLSMGGTAAWVWALGNPERFAAVAPVCGQGIDWYAAKLKHTPVYAFHGDIDPTVCVHESVSMVSNINQHGGNAKLKLLHGVKHDAWNYAYDDELIDWFMQYTLPEIYKSQNGGLKNEKQL